MTFKVEIIADSIGPNGKRLTTLTATYPRFIHAEIMTHRAFERNAASSRAIPWAKMRQEILDNPVIPLVFGSEQKGMQTGGEVEHPEVARHNWLVARSSALNYADSLHMQGVHKSLVNRIVEPWMWITTIITATEWNNFFRQRCHPDAEIHFQKIAYMIREARENSRPRELWAGDHHLPFVTKEDLWELRAELKEKEGQASSALISQLCRISTARVARVSYLTHEGKRDIEKDLQLFDRLVQGSGFGHWSPHGHVAEATVDQELRSGPFVGWKQYRKTFPNENAAG